MVASHEGFYRDPQSFVSHQTSPTTKRTRTLYRTSNKKGTHIILVHDQVVHAAHRAPRYGGRASPTTHAMPPPAVQLSCRVMCGDGCEKVIQHVRAIDGAGDRVRASIRSRERYTRQPVASRVSCAPCYARLVVPGGSPSKSVRQGTGAGIGSGNLCNENSGYSSAASPCS